MTATRESRKSSLKYLKSEEVKTLILTQIQGIVSVKASEIKEGLDLAYSQRSLQASTIEGCEDEGKKVGKPRRQKSESVA